MTVGCGVGVSGELLGYKLIGLRQAIDSLELEFAQTAAEFARTSEYDEQGSTSPIDWIRHSCHMTSTSAAACLAVGKNLQRLPESDQAEQVENRSLHLSMWEDGSYVLNGVLDAVGGAAVRTALEPLARKSGEDDARERDHRLADALVELAEGSMQKPQIQVTSSVETLLGLAGAPAAEMDFALPISSKTVERFACDSGVTRVLL